MNNQNGMALPFSIIAVKVTTIFVMLTFLVFGAYALETGNFRAIHYAMPAALLVAIIGMKFIVALVPIKDLVLLLITTWGIHFGFEILISLSPLMYFVGEFSLQFICIFIFGRSWVSKGYISAHTNRWPE